MKTWTLRFRAVDMANFEELQKGLKTVETRAATAKYRAIEKGDTLRIVCGKKELKKRIARVRVFRSIPAMLTKIPMKKVMPSVRSVGEMRKAYYGYPGYKEKIRRHGIIAFDLA
jgi:ASC-1-like (ASCH) protein